MPRPLPPMPAPVRPQLATLVDRPPTGPGWRHELKHDGYRSLAFIEAGRVRVATRRGLDWTARLGSLPAALARIGARQAILDGEVVAQRPDGGSDFGLLLDALNGGSPRSCSTPSIFYGSTVATFARSP